jgi:hypothetical protein
LRQLDERIEVAGEEVVEHDTRSAHLSLVQEAPMLRPDPSEARSVPANRTIIGAFAARRIVLKAPDPTPHRPLRLPKHVRYRCATPRRFVLGNRICFPSVAQKTSLHRSHVRTTRIDGTGGGPFKTRDSPDLTSVTATATVPG